MTATETHRETKTPVAWLEGLNLPDPVGDAPVPWGIGRTRRSGTDPAVIELTSGVRIGEVRGSPGPSGSGWSTTVPVVVGLVQPIAGRVERYGHDARTHSGVVARSTHWRRGHGPALMAEGIRRLATHGATLVHADSAAGSPAATGPCTRAGSQRWHVERSFHRPPVVT